MRKAIPHIDSGAGYIQLSRLPFNQAIKLRDWLPDTSLITMNLGEGLVNDCVQYSEYEYWFDFSFSQETESEFDI